MEETYYDVKKAVPIEYDDEEYGYTVNRRAKQFVEKLSEEEKELFKRIVSDEDLDVAKKFLRDAAAEIRPHAKSLLQKGARRAKMGKFSLPMGEELYKRVRSYLLQGALPEDPGPFRRRNGGPF